MNQDLSLRNHNQTLLASSSPDLARRHGSEYRLIFFAFLICFFGALFVGLYDIISGQFQMFANPIYFYLFIAMLIIFLFISLNLLPIVTARNMMIFNNGITLPYRQLKHIIKRNPYFLQLRDIQSIVVLIRYDKEIGVMIKKSQKDDFTYFLDDILDREFIIKFLSILQNNTSWKDRISIENKTKTEINDIQTVIDLIKQSKLG